MGFLSTLSGSLLSIVLSLRQKLRETQKIGLLTAVFRLVALIVASFTFLDSRSATAVSVGAVVIQTLLVNRLVRSSIEWNAPISGDYRNQVIGIVKKQVPLTLYFCIQSQIGFWLISVFGSAHKVAEVGALSRFALIFSLVSSVVSAIVVPRFARCQTSQLLRVRFSQIFGVYTVFAGSIVACGAFAPKLFLWFLGPGYSNLGREVWLVFLGSGLSTLGMSLFSLVTCKGWIPPAKVTIPLEIATQILLILTMDISSVRGVLLLGAFGAIPPIAMLTIVAMRGIQGVAIREKMQNGMPEKGVP
jgi:hypothetical protein